MNFGFFNPDGVGVDNGNYFGMDFKLEEARLVLISAPWDVTSSYGAGSVYAPDAIIDASTQLDFYDPVSPDRWREGIATAPVNYSLEEDSQRLRGDAERIIKQLENGSDIASDYFARKLRRINEGCAAMNAAVFDEVSHWIAEGRITGLVGGDHSTAYGSIKAVARHNEGLGILHFDAHRDLREAYESFEYSHASVMFNVLRDVPEVSKLVQVGVRDFCYTEKRIAETDPRIVSFEWNRLANDKFEGRTWASICAEIVETLPQTVYISMDIDALSIEYCPHTGTPVAGGLTFDEAVYLMDCVARSGRRIAGFDLVEVVPDMNDKTDASVGARMLYKMCGIALKSNE
ncbi:MAG: agmatinase family protein [Alistipes sp.]|nr:agmatinase family protein [Alistipes sp.]